MFGGCRPHCSFNPRSKKVQMTSDRSLLGLLSALLLVVVVVVSPLGCDLQTHYLDPITDYGDKPSYVPTGTPVLEVGFYVEQLYVPLEPGEAFPIVYGLQGGTWSMPALRIRGIAAQALVVCTATTVAGEEVGSTETEANFAWAYHGWLEVQAFPIPISHPPPNDSESIDDLYGQTATLICSVTDSEKREASVSIAIILMEG